ncbi:MAG: hypothetical protein FWG99_12065 [Treponema sp.]|nr:hypothetical protein [Treponema sp.]
MVKKAANKNIKTGKVVKKSTAVKTKDGARESLAVELRGLIPKLNTEGLAFLVKQARVHIYNMQVDELNKAARAVNTASAKAAGITRAAKKPAGENLRITGSESGSSYYIYYQNDNIVFSRDEMRQLLKMVNAEGTDVGIQTRVFNWFNTERRDVFSLIPMVDKFDPRLKTIIALLKKNFRLKA